ncbi:hydrogenase maturation protease [Saccharopolyspora phatthalungensis]|uniref:Hydrogenase maturation protease n=1 Tax=Saccharopolyspora phatthalungensis TaxID=664693 RepID=A0A840Q893_9PSEU|nr:hydrogenase maturation protease [Saccharopolyspora phatthalungensis]MBB5155961.1 hydrogenase maturation protease [Saccharopolyspora phatthalungensis]
MHVPARIAVIGVGNEYRRDDGVGWAVVSRMSERARSRPLPGETILTACDGDPARLISMWEDTHLTIVVDAAHAHPAHPGRVHRLQLEGDQPWQTGSETSSHGLGLGDAVKLARVLDRLPRQLVVFAVECAETGLGSGLSQQVSDVVEPLAKRIEEEIEHAVVRAISG